MSGKFHKHLKPKQVRTLSTDPNPGFAGKRELRKREQDSDRRGVSLGDISRDTQPARYVSVLLRGLLIFLGAYGTVWGVASSFGLTYEPMKVFLGILFLSVFSASIYYNRYTFYIGYVIMFISFFVFSVMTYSYINSGFQAFVNELNEHYVDYFSLPALRVSEEVISDRSITVPATCIFLGWVYCIMLNVTISSYMNPALTFIITFLPLQTAFYIDIVPPYLCMTMLIMCYASVLVLSRAGNYALPYRYKKYEVFVRHRKKKGFDDTYILSAKGMVSVFGVSLVFSLIFFVISGTLFGDDYSTKYISNSLKNKTDNFVEVMVMNGFTSIFNRYSATGGLARGKLGGIGSVTPDYETDLIVTYQPTSTDSIYLRAFVGNTYSMDRFLEDRDSDYELLNEPFRFEEDDPIVTMTIDNVDADQDYYFYPYHTLDIEGDKGGTYEASYIQMPLDGSYDDSDKEMVDYTMYVFDHYTAVPSNLFPVLSDTVEKADIIGEKRGAEGELESCYRLQEYFRENYRYSLQPGRTPLGTDVVEYFLSSQDRGYCMHYAASSTLLLRYIGIPSRYCEGYFLQATDLAQGEIVSEEDGVKTVRVELTDAAAHAWTEVYIINYGWVPFEMTPPSFGEEEDVAARGLMGILSGLFNAANRDEAAGSGAVETAEGAVSTFGSALNSIGFLIKPVAYSLMTIILLLIMIPIMRKIAFRIRIANLAKKGKYGEALLARYRNYTAKLCKKKILSTSNADTHEIAKDLSEKVSSKGNDAGDISSKIYSVAETVRRAAFSGKDISSDEYGRAMSDMNIILKAALSKG